MYNSDNSSNRNGGNKNNIKLQVLNDDKKKN
jgi:hypothetical protein